MDDETNRLIDAADVRERSVDRINLKKRRFLLKVCIQELIYMHVFKIQAVTRDFERERFQKQIPSIVQFSMAEQKLVYKAKYSD